MKYLNQSQPIPSHTDRATLSSIPLPSQPAEHLVLPLCILQTTTKGEMNDDLVIVPAKLGEAVDASEYEEILPTSPP